MILSLSNAVYNPKKVFLTFFALTVTILIPSISHEKLLIEHAYYLHISLVLNAKIKDCNCKMA